MNCLEFRRHCLAEPGNQASEYLRHVQDCPRCAEYASGIIQADKKLSEALRLGVPDNLASRIILRQSIYRGHARQQQTRRMYALAAGVLLAVGLVSGWFMMTWVPQVDRAVIARINAAPASLVARQKISDNELVRVLRALGGELKGDLGKVSYAGIYYVREHQCGQLVVQGTQGPVTVLLMPGVYVRHERALRSTRFNGIIVPTNTGSMAIVGEKGEPLHETVRTLRSAVTWRL